MITRTDVTARKHAEADARNQRQQLTHLSRAAVLGQLSGAFAHELKQPLTSILGNAEAALSMLQKGGANQHEFSEILQDIVQDDERAAQVIQRLRALLGKGDTQYAPVDLNDLVRESLELTHSEFVTRNVVATLHLDSTMPTVLADRVQMQQVVLNLLMNACEAMVGTPLPRRQAIVSTRFLPVSEAAEITCRTTARASPPGDTERIFQPFVTTKAHGLGLGLAICRSVAEAHHGVLWAENASEGGAIFHIKIPDCRRSAMNDNEQTQTVFLVDDDASVRSALTRALNAEGFHVMSWASADAFLADYDPEKPGCLVADVAMPGTDGLQLQQLLTASDRSLPIVFITGNANVRMSVQAMRAGAVTFLPKPVRLSELAAAVREALDRDHTVRQRRATRAAIQSRLSALTARERQVFDLVVAGKMNKQIAAQLGAAEKTVKVHRGRVMFKMRVRSVAELVTLATQAREASRPL